MNKEILRKLGFAQEVEAVENRQCPFCRTSINYKDFKTDLDLREHEISGLCQSCIDKTFAEPEDIEDDDYFDEINYNPYSGHNELDDVNYLDWEGDE